MFKIIGKDGKEYGPVSVEQIVSWIKQGRLDAQSPVKPAEATEWATLGALPQFREALVPAPVLPPVPGVPAPGAASARLSGLAIASLVLGILGLFSVALTAIPGLVLGIIALIKIQKSPAKLSGSGLAIAGICVSGVMLLMIPIMAAMLLPALARAKGKAQSITCMNNVKQINLAVIMYADDHQGYFPGTNQWCEVLKPYLGGSTAAFRCPAQGDARCSYAYNANLEGKKMSDLRSPATTVLVFSSADGWNLSGGNGVAAAHSHAGQALTVGFADGHTEIARPVRVPAFIWNP